MKRIFTLIAVLAATLSMQAADVTIYVEATDAPYLYVWGGGASNGDWPGTQMTETATVQGHTFWKKSFTISGAMSIIFNNGGAGVQTADITGITTDRYFTFDATNSNKQTNWTDISDQFIEVPDAEVTTLTLAGNHNSWGSDPFNVVVAGKTFNITVDLSALDITDDYWEFKIKPNDTDWVGYSQVTITDQPAWLAEAASDGNFQVDLEGMAAADRQFTITATWGGGKHADENWTFTIAQGTTGIGATLNDNVEMTNDNVVYDLSGRRVDANYHGIVIQNGKKVLK
ncbi:MAG: starch-binding protein [Prevotella sp.]|nr:starch-binding protein [Prevotella sp.]